MGSVTVSLCTRPMRRPEYMPYSYRFKVHGTAQKFFLLGGADLHPYDSAIPYAFPHRLLPTVGTSERRLHVDRACRVNSRSQ